MKKELKAFILKNRRIGYVQVLYTPRRIATYMFVMCFIFTLIGLSASYEYSKVCLRMHQCPCSFVLRDSGF